MAYKFIVLAAFVACASAGVIQTGVPVVGPVAYTAPVAKTVVTSTVDTEHDPHPQYSYSYDVHDSLTGDSKAQHESRDGDVVHGSYSVVDPDGTKRTVDYTADDVNGFNAVVSKEPATVVAKTVAAAPVVAAAPAAPVVAKVHAEPVVHAAPAVATYAAAPLVAKYHAAPAVATYAAPVVHHAYHAAPAAYTTYAAAAPLVAKYHAAPAAYTTYAAAAPVVHHAYHAAPATYTSYAAAPLVAKYHAAPAAYY